jgi:hypothetical protein
LIIVNAIIARRKGKEPILYVLLALVPIANLFSTIWLVSLTDKKVTEEIEALRSMVDPNAQKKGGS